MLPKLVNLINDNFEKQNINNLDFVVTKHKIYYDLIMFMYNYNVINIPTSYMLKTGLWQMDPVSISEEGEKMGEEEFVIMMNCWSSDNLIHFSEDNLDAESLYEFVKEFNNLNTGLAIKKVDSKKRRMNTSYDYLTIEVCEKKT